MSGPKVTVILVGSVFVILIAGLGFAFAQDDANPAVGATLGALVAAALCAVAFRRPQRRDAAVASRSGTSTTTVDLRQRRNAAARRFVVTLGAIVALWLVVFFVLG